MKKRIFIAIHYLEIGGAERSLIGLLNALDYSKYEVDLLVYHHHGEFMGLIPKQVNLLPEIGSYAAIEKPMMTALKEGHLGVVLGRLFAKWKAKQFAKNHKGNESIAVFQYIHTYVVPFLPSLHNLGEYDLAISFLIPHNIVRDKVRAKQKWAWIHTDYSFLNLDTKVELPIWSAFDRIISISKDVTKGFLSKFPSLKDRILLIENILSEQFVREQAEMPINNNEIPNVNGQLKLCSVGRFSYPKAFDRAAYICKGLIDKGFDLVWYIVGYGGDEHIIRKAIEETGMQERFILLGKKENPYPYINACDIYVQPSRYEGKAVTVREAQILCKPVAITAYPTSASQLQNGIDGIIIPNDVEGAVNELARFIKNVGLQEQIKAYLQVHHYGNEEEVIILDQYLS